MMSDSQREPHLYEGAWVWAYQAYSTKKNPHGCPTWTGPWEVVGTMSSDDKDHESQLYAIASLYQGVMAPQWHTSGSAYRHVASFRHPFRSHSLWPFNERKAKRHQHKTEIALSNSNGVSFMEIQEGWDPTDSPVPDYPPRPTPIGEEVHTRLPSEDRDKLRIRAEFMNKVRELTIDTQSGEPSRIKDARVPQNVPDKSRTNRLSQLSPLLESPAIKLQDQRPKPRTTTEGGGQWGMIQPDCWNKEGIPIYDIPLPSELPAYGYRGPPTEFEYPPTRLPDDGDITRTTGSREAPRGYDYDYEDTTRTTDLREPPQGYEYSISWYRNLCWSRPEPSNGKGVQHREVWVERQKVEAVIDEGISVGIASRAFLATLSAYLPRIPTPVLLTKEQNIPPGTEATYLEIRSYTKEFQNYCLHPVLVAPSLEGESLVLGTAYLRDNLTTGYRSHYNPPRRDLRNRTGLPPAGWCQATYDQNRRNHQFLYTTPWTTQAE